MMTNYHIGQCRTTIYQTDGRYAIGGVFCGIPKMPENTKKNEKKQVFEHFVFLGWFRK